jgi:hypothetical protein
MGSAGSTPSLRVTPWQLLTTEEKARRTLSGLAEKCPDIPMAVDQYTHTIANVYELCYLCKFMDSRSWIRMAYTGRRWHVFGCVKQVHKVIALSSMCSYRSCLLIQGVPGVTCQTSGGCSLC